MPNFASPIWMPYIYIPLASPFGGHFSIDSEHIKLGFLQLPRTGNPPARLFRES